MKKITILDPEKDLIKDNNYVYLGVIGSRYLYDKQFIFRNIDGFISLCGEDLDIPSDAFIIVTCDNLGVGQVAQNYAEEKNYDVIHIQSNLDFTKIFKASTVLLVFIDDKDDSIYPIIFEAEKNGLYVFVFDYS